LSRACLTTLFCVILNKKTAGNNGLIDANIDPVFHLTFAGKLAYGSVFFPQKKQPMIFIGRSKDFF
jgi:hypothetical protein